MSIRVVLYLLDQFTNTRALSLLHNGMWLDSSVYNGLPRSITNCFVFNVEAYAFMERTCLGTFWPIIWVCFNNGLPRSIMCRFNVETLAVIRWTYLGSSCFNNGLPRSIVFDSFVKRTCIDLLGTGSLSSILRGSRVSSNNGLPRSIVSNSGLLRSIMIWIWNWLVRLETFECVAQLVLLIVEHLLNPILFSSHVSGRSLEEAEVTHILSRFWFLQFPSWWLSEDNKLGVYCKGWWRSIASEWILILSFEQVWDRSNTQCFDVSSTFLLAPCKTRCFQVNYIWIFVFFVHGIDKQKEYLLSVVGILTSRY